MEKETAVNPADRVICALKDRGLTINRSEVESALIDDDKNVENIKWVEEHLGSDTLLSQEELTLYGYPPPLFPPRPHYFEADRLLSLIVSAKVHNIEELRRLARHHLRSRSCRDTTILGR